MSVTQKLNTFSDKNRKDLNKEATIILDPDSKDKKPFEPSKVKYKQ